MTTHRMCYMEASWVGNHKYRTTVRHDTRKQKPYFWNFKIDKRIKVDTKIILWGGIQGTQQVDFIYTDSNKPFKRIITQMTNQNTILHRPWGSEETYIEETLPNKRVRHWKFHIIKWNKKCTEKIIDLIWNKKVRP
jgi:hypothetical protein